MKPDLWLLLYWITLDYIGVTNKVPSEFLAMNRQDLISQLHSAYNMLPCSATNGRHIFSFPFIKLLVHSIFSCFLKCDLTKVQLLFRNHWTVSLSSHVQATEQQCDTSEWIAASSFDEISTLTACTSKQSCFGFKRKWLFEFCFSSKPLKCCCSFKMVSAFYSCWEWRQAQNLTKLCARTLQTFSHINHIKY